MVKIAPSILSVDFCSLGRDIDRVSSCADWLHVDVMDGRLVPNISVGLPVLKSIRAYTDMFLDVHLMIERPGRYVPAFAEAGADLLSFHLESDTPEALRAALDADPKDLLTAASSLGRLAGAAHRGVHAKFGDGRLRASARNL